MTAIDIVERLIAAIEFECPPIRDGVEVERRTRILESCAREARAEITRLTNGSEVSHHG